MLRLVKNQLVITEGTSSHGIPESYPACGSPRVPVVGAESRPEPPPTPGLVVHVDDARSNLKRIEHAVPAASTAVRTKKARRRGPRTDRAGASSPWLNSLDITSEGKGLEAGSQLVSSAPLRPPSSRFATQR